MRVAGEEGDVGFGLEAQVVVPVRGLGGTSRFDDVHLGG